MNTRSYRSLLAVVAIPLALVVINPASASIFSSIGKAANSVGKAADNVVKGATGEGASRFVDVGLFRCGTAASMAQTLQDPQSQPPPTQSKKQSCWHPGLLRNVGIAEQSCDFFQSRRLHRPGSPNNEEDALRRAERGGVLRYQRANDAAIRQQKSGIIGPARPPFPE